MGEKSIAMSKLEEKKELVLYSPGVVGDLSRLTILF